MLDPSLYTPNIPGLDEALPVDVYSELVGVDVEDIIDQVKAKRVLGVKFQGMWYVEAPSFCEDKLVRIYAGRNGSHKRQRDEQVRPATDRDAELMYAKALGLSGRVTRDEVKRCWRELSNQYHPDKVQHLGPKLRLLAESEMKDINAAYEYFLAKYQF